MRKLGLVVALALVVIALMSCGEDTSGEVCGSGRFEMMPAASTALPEGAPNYNIERTVCWHSTQPVAGCPITNYRIPPRTDFSDYIDIFYGGDCAANDLDGSFEQEMVLGTVAGTVVRTARYSLSGTPAVEPPQAPTDQLVGSGSYTTDDGEQGMFNFIW
jgi:hypothetical protein